MDRLPLALSVHHFVDSVGAEAGFASLVAVAILILLYFAQARETATLRARADEAGARVQELEYQVAELSEQVTALPAEISVSRAPGAHVAAPGAASGQVAAGVAAGGAPDARMLPPSAPAGVAAPALAAATRLIPDPESFVHEPTLEPEPATAAGAAGAGNGARQVAVPAPAAAASIQRPVRAPGRVAQGRVPGAAGAGRQAAVGQSRATGPRRPQASPQRQPPQRSRGRLVLAALVAVVALAAVVAGVIVLANRGSAASASRSSAAAALASQRTRAASAAVVPSTVTVSVLNGTDSFGLAGRVAQRLVAQGYRKGQVTNASDQTQTSTVVAYMTSSERREALAVAAALKLSRTSVQPIDPNTKAIACPPTQPCTSAVVVTIGRDLASQ